MKVIKLFLKSRWTWMTFSKAVIHCNINCLKPSSTSLCSSLGMFWMYGIIRCHWGSSINQHPIIQPIIVYTYTWYWSYRGNMLTLDCLCKSSHPSIYLSFPDICLNIPIVITPWDFINETNLSWVWKSSWRKTHTRSELLLCICIMLCIVSFQ